jgi:hypothetical protein
MAHVTVEQALQQLTDAMEVSVVKARTDAEQEQAIKALRIIEKKAKEYLALQSAGKDA